MRRILGLSGERLADGRGCGEPGTALRPVPRGQRVALLGLTTSPSVRDEVQVDGLVALVLLVLVASEHAGVHRVGAQALTTMPSVRVVERHPLREADAPCLVSV